MPRFPDWDTEGQRGQVISMWILSRGWTSRKEIHFPRAYKPDDTRFPERTSVDTKKDTSTKATSWVTKSVRVQG